MPSRRMIHPDFWKSESIATLTRDERFLFIGLFSNADDQGRLHGHPALIRSTIFPFDDISIDEIVQWLKAIESIGSIIIYEADGKQLIQIISWWKYQRPKWAWPSDYSPPPGWTDRLRYRAGNEVVKENWDTPIVGYSPENEEDENEEDEYEEDDEETGSDLTVRPERDHSETAVISAPSGRNRSRSSNTATTARASPGNAFVAYQNAGGTINKIAADQLGDLIDECEVHRTKLPRGSPGADISGDGWVSAAVEEAVTSGVKRISIRYVSAILDRWRSEGFRSKRGKGNGSHKRSVGGAKAPRGEKGKQPDREQADIQGAAISEALKRRSSG